MKRVFSLIVFVLLAPHGVSASDSESFDRALDRLYAVIKMDLMMDATIHSLVDAQAQRDPAFEKVKPEFIKFLRDNAGFKAVESEMRKLYKETFTETEINDIIAFYETPTGKKAISAMPELVAKASMIGQERIKAKLPEFLKSIEPKLKEASQAAEKK